MKKLLYGLVTALTFFAATSCVEDLNVESINPNQSSKIDVDALFTKIYNTLGTTGQRGPDGSPDVAGVDEGTSAFYRMMFSLNEFPADMVYWIWPDAGVDDIRNATWNSSNTLVKGLYSRLYFDISLCNLFLEETEDMTDGDMATRRAEVRFMRALNYYYLLDMFGNNVPKVTASALSENPMPFTQQDRLFDYIETELLVAKDDMTDAMTAKTAYYRVDKAAAWLLLSRLYLGSAVYLDKEETECKEYYDKAALYADSVISSSKYTLADSYAHLFMGDNDMRSSVNTAHNEVILAIAQDGEHVRGYGAAQFLIAATHTDGMAPWGSTDQWKCIRTRSQLVKLFFPDLSNYGIEYKNDEDDIHTGDVTTNEAFMDAVAEMRYKGEDTTLTRLAKDDRALFCNYRVYNDTSVFVCNMGRTNRSDEFKSGWAITKFSNIYADGGSPSNSQWVDMDVPLMRKAEAYLNYAEAVLRGGNMVSMSVDDAVNALRERANAEPLSGVTLDDILDERGREFYCEGYRRSDLIRFGKFGGETGYYWEWQGGAQLGKNFDEYRNLYPIPLSDIIINNNLDQNEGY
ncbi:MAG: RagB/SusD family nutrient uptake outer membrane protein [bacterium]|uniref:RagB/SusD family nutrient uptake outer membrane protein n=1 Tax=Candidatus Aphodosoma intestinipullorum TaxID=2840674 RepID=A0A940DKX9_9BACT|nr:RagB/SusD family nutrient uptake outer membrane protein [Candidatus Aphodosoma intestinipullorum]